jgi:outer membrane immunogenic protein
MKKLATYVVAGVALFGSPAVAADLARKMPVKAPPPPPPAPIYNWTGFYVGGNVGYSWGRASADVNYFAPNSNGALAPCGNTFVPGALCINGSDTVDMNGVIGGVQAGYNWQNANYLLGVEADFQGTGQRGTRDFTASFNAGFNTATFLGQNLGTAAISITERMPWMGTVRGRVGYIANQWLVYATGGLAYGRIEVDSSASATAVVSTTCSAPINFNIATPSTCPVWGFSGSGVTKIGWTVGGGTELALGGNWTARVEYLFVDLGSFDTTFTGLSGCFGVSGVGAGAGNLGCTPEAAGTGTIHSRITDNIVHVGLNYQFH